VPATTLTKRPQSADASAWNVTSKWREKCACVNDG
jgi:hypothetical protein